MLVLSRKKTEQIIIGTKDKDTILKGQCIITVVDIRGDKVKIGIEVDREVPVFRSELVTD